MAVVILIFISIVVVVLPGLTVYILYRYYKEGQAKTPEFKMIFGYFIYMFLLAVLGQAQLFSWPQLEINGGIDDIYGYFFIYVFSFIFFAGVKNDLRKPPKDFLKSTALYLFFFVIVVPIFFTYHLYVIPYLTGYVFSVSMPLVTQEYEVTNFPAGLVAAFITMCYLGSHMFVTMLLCWRVLNKSDFDPL